MPCDKFDQDWIRIGREIKRQVVLVFVYGNFALQIMHRHCGVRRYDIA